MLGFVPQAVSNRLVLQREANTLAGQSQPPPPPPKWPGMISSEQLSLELHQVEREIGKRTRELGMVSALVVVVLGGGEGCGVTPHTSHLTTSHLTALEFWNHPGLQGHPPRALQWVINI